MESARRTIRSYSGFHQADAEIHSPASEDELAALLARARAEGRTVTLRGAGLSLDRQSIGPRVLSLALFRRLALDVEERRLTVGAGVTWGEAFDAATRHGLVPPILPTTRRSTIAGTLSANSLSRFSPLWGREGHNVERIRVMLADGSVRDCSRRENTDLFHSVIGGFGTVAVLLEATYRLIEVPRPACVRTWLRRRSGTAHLREDLHPTRGTDETRCSALYDDGRTLRCVASRSRYAPDERLARTLLYQRPDGVRAALEWALQYWDWMGPLFWSFGYHALLRDGRPYVDPLEDFTFFMEGNVRARSAALRLGLPFRVMEQTWVLPEAPGRLEAFVERVVAECRRERLKTALFDLVYLPADEEFLLSSSRALPGYGVNLAFEGLRGRRPAAVERVFRTLTRECGALGGRLHLVKNLWADPADVRPMYAEILPAFRAVKAKYDPDGVLSTELVERTFGLGTHEARQRIAAASTA